MPNLSVTRFPGGINNVAETALAADMGQLDPTIFHTFFTDFDSMGGMTADATDSVDWDFDIVEAGAGEAAVALVDGDGGLVTITNDAADNDRVFVYKKGESFRFAAGKRLWFKARYKVSSATDEDSIVGLVMTGTNPIGTIPTDGVWFQQTDASANLVLRIVKNSTATDTTVTTLTADTFVEVGFYYDGVSAIQYFLNGAYTGTAAVTNLPDDEDLAIMFGCQNGSAAARTMTLDYIYASKER